MSAKKCPPTNEELIMEEMYPITTKLDEYVFDLLYNSSRRGRVENLHLDKWDDVITLWDIYRHNVRQRRTWNVYKARVVLLLYEYAIDTDVLVELDITLQEARDIIVSEYLGLMIKKTLMKK